MVVKSLSLLLALCCVSQLSVLPSPSVLLLCVPLLIAVYYLRYRLKSATIPVAVFVCGFVYGCIYASIQLSLRLPAPMLGVEVEVVGTIVDLPNRDGRRLRFLVELESIRAIEDATAAEKAGRIRLSWYGKDAPDLKAGNKVKLVVKLKAPSGFMNPGGFDLERWLMQNKIIATGYVRDKSFDVSKSIISQSIAPVSSTRNLLQRKMLLASEGLSSQGVILALAVGERSGVSTELWDAFISTGTNHLLAISGLHISLVAGFFGMLMQLFWRYSGLSSTSTRRSCSLAVALLAAFCYAAMAGFSVPTVRAFMMFSVLVSLLILRRHQRRAQSLSIALLVVCLLDPLAVLAPGFWMSFAAVAVLFLVFSNSQNKGRLAFFKRLLRGHLLVSVGLYPLTLLFFGQASLIAPLANLIVTPLVGVLVTPLVFVSAIVVLVSVPLATCILIFVDLLLQLTFVLLGFLSNLPFALLKLSVVSPTALMLSAVTALLFVVPLRPVLRCLSLLLLLPLIFPRAGLIKDGDYKIVFLDVGQGTSVVVMTANHILVYDTGDQFSKRFSAANAALIPYLLTSSVSTIDRLIVSHADRDHSGGADEVLDQMHVLSLMMSAPLPQRPEASHAVCTAGDRWVWDNVTFTILHPQSTSVGSENNRSCVLHISSAAGTDSLLTGDIEAYAEGVLLRSGSLQAVDVLLSPHHGSASSSGALFISALNPAYVVHSAGYKNRFDFPRQEVTERYRALGVTQLTTATSGAIEMMATDSGVTVSEYRGSVKRWWHRH